MRKKLSILLSAIMVLTLMAAGPTAAQVHSEPPDPTVTVCITLGPDETLNLGPDVFIGPGSFEVEVPLSVASELIRRAFATLGPCGADGGDGGSSSSGDGGGDGGGGAATPLELTQDTEQEAESGDIDQSFEVTSTGDNSNQCTNGQGAAQTGNSQNVIDLVPVFSEADDFEFEEVRSTIESSPTNTATCDQQVNQAASASG